MSEEDASALAYEIKPGIFKNMVTHGPRMTPSNNYALLIDEINRGNVASIFGELIALIEEDKRKGVSERTPSAATAHSREEFVVPWQPLHHRRHEHGGPERGGPRDGPAAPLHLRGRSIPNPNLIDSNPEQSWRWISRRLLITINARIEKLLDKDHCIGHSYFWEMTRKTTHRNCA